MENRPREAIPAFGPCDAGDVDGKDDGHQSLGNDDGHWGSEKAPVECLQAQVSDLGGNPEQQV